MVVLRPRPTVDSSGTGEGSCSGSAAEQLDEQTMEFISPEMMHNILDKTLVIFGTIK